MHSSTATKVLLVEDNPVDVRLMRYALDEEKDWQTEVTVAEDGELAIDFLLRRGEFVSVPRPDLVILDLNLPKREGTEVLTVIRTTAELRTLPVIIVSSSPADVVRAKVSDARVEATCYFVKPMAIDDFLALGKRVRQCFEEHSMPGVMIRTCQP
jgi:two-component system, chemotaxis family, response regulator Rcp1